MPLSAPSAFLYALLLHGVLGFIDTVVNHELLAKLPARRAAAEEEGLHAAREFIFACLFASIAWFAWHGALVWWIAALLLGEVLVTARDVVVEGEIRVLPVSERVLHLLLFMNLGALVVLGAFTLGEWHVGEVMLIRVDHGWASWVLTAMAVGAFGWAVRDGRAALRLARKAA
ncbi:MAG: dependent epimerase/dehydratase family protein [Massilia sp.]|nr:dependent epimerase/dehydratase family protein [Massilia sp.]MDB5789995.1 dependent epimerase/dehydratase family protein [Massilia sp.]